MPRLILARSTPNDEWFFAAASDVNHFPTRSVCANPFDKFQLGLRQLTEDLTVQRMADNDKIVTRYMDDKEFGSAAFDVLSKAIYELVLARDRPEAAD